MRPRSPHALLASVIMEAVMAHLTLQLGAAIVVPFGVSHHHPTDARRWKTRAVREAATIKAGLRWKARSLREAAAIEAGLPLRSSRSNRCTLIRLLSSLPARGGGPLDGNEA